MRYWLYRQKRSIIPPLKYLLGGEGAGSMMFGIREWHKLFPKLRLKPGQSMTVEIKVTKKKGKPNEADYEAHRER